MFQISRQVFLGLRASFLEHNTISAPTRKHISHLRKADNDVRISRGFSAGCVVFEVQGGTGPLTCRLAGRDSAAQLSAAPSALLTSKPLSLAILHSSARRTFLTLRTLMA